ncbi:MAG TPA: sensor domain-containing protein [Trebonia sp.]|jgi:signal transduction histidine kinase|nr:sensor domain-containing protein [Trebonia sp.]
MSLIRGLVSARTWLAFVHHVAGLILAIASFTIVFTLFTVGLVTTLLALAGLPVLGIALRCSAAFAAVERARFALLLGQELPRWPADPRRGYRWLVVPTRSMLTTRATWAQVSYSVLRLPVSVVNFSLTVTVWSAGLAALTAPLYARQLPGGGPNVDGHYFLTGTEPLALCAVAGLVVLLAAAPLTRGLGSADAALARWLLSPPRDAELKARVTQLEVSRERVVDAAEAERRRIERDLHDGAQQRLVAVAMELGRAKAKFADDVDAAAALVDQAHSEAKAALVELRDLVRGVHPPVLTDRGLDAALSGLAARCPVPVSLQVDVPVRPRPAVEAVAYFTVAEALTNIAKHSRASQVRVVVDGGPGPAGTLNIVVSDDGIGGANAAGAGLSGLADRIAGIDGALSVESPPGGPTIVSAVIPCA